MDWVQILGKGNLPEGSCRFFSNLKAVSGIYETEPVGGPDQDSYLNIVIELDTDLGARELLEHAQMLEKRANRKREIRWGPRTLDVDVLWVEGKK